LPELNFDEEEEEENEEIDLDELEFK